MNTEDIWTAVDAERRGLVDLLESLTAADWRHASLCPGWQVRDVVAHLVISAHAHIGRILVGLLRARGNVDRMMLDTATRLAAKTGDRELLAELCSTVGSRFTAVSSTPADRLMDLLVHGQDIAIPLGVQREMPTAAAQVALERVWNPRVPFYAATRLAPYRVHAVDTEWAQGSGPLIEGPVSALLLLATGRDAAALPQLRGEGKEMLRNG